MGAPGRAPFYLEQSLFTTEDTGDTEEDFCEFHLTLICFVVWAICEYRGGMAFSRPKRRQYSEDELYEYAVGALGRRMRTVAELKRLMRARVEEPESEYADTLVELVILRLKDHGYLNY